MNIAPVGSFNVVQSTREIGDLLKETVDATMGLEHKLLTASITELVDQNKGNEIDVSA